MSSAENHSDQTWSFSEFQRINALCEEFNRAWITGQAPAIEDFLARYSDLPRPLVLPELVRLERDLRRGDGNSPREDEYLQRFPNDHEAIARVWRSNASSEEPGLHATAYASIATPNSEFEPTQLGRFKILRKLGVGGFGVVYLAHDPQFNRDVALKVPHRDMLISPERREEIKKEALTGKKLDHPHLVKTYDFEEEGDQVFIVQQFVDGCNLADWYRANRPNQYRVVEVMIPVAQALAHLHERGYTHRDLKPRNILIDNNGKVYVADFGLTLHEDEHRRHKGEIAGTLPFMSPEQVERQEHPLDGQSDIFSFGIILYLLLTDRLPFGGRPPTRDSAEYGQYVQDLQREICEHDPKPPRMICPALSRALQEICLRCLEKRKRHRYQSGYDLADELRLFLEKSGPSSQTSESQRSIRVVPRGLRSFDAADAGFFLELLPGPRTSEGLPASISFWKNRLTGMTGTTPIDVGVVYGPSGSGKSSLIKAGLLPVLGDKFVPLVIEATTEDTETRLLKALRQSVPGLPPGDSLIEACRYVGEFGLGDDRRIVLVFDQFEQWLHSHPDLSESELLAALKNCNRKRLQALFLVRDDFWMPLTRFMDRLEVSLQENNNIAAVDLFDRDHARKILIAFGIAYGRLPQNGELSATQDQFLQEAIDGLAQEGRIICVRLALFVEMMKDRPWTRAELETVGGAKGIGVAFLEQKFGRNAQANYRLHCAAAKKVLDRLLPPIGNDLKGQMRSVDELRAVAGYSTPRAFEQLIQILNTDLKLLTPTASNHPDGRPDDEANDPVCYQLTHDYLVPSVREWLLADLSHSRAGRAQLRLRERADDWNRQPESRRLPSVTEWLSIMYHVPVRTWTPAQRGTMRAATWDHGIRWGAALLALVAIGLSIRAYSLSHDAILMAQKKEGQRKQATLLVDAVLSAPAEAVPYAINSLEPFRSDAVPMLEDFMDNETNDQQKRLRSAAVLAHFDDVRHEFLVENIGSAAPSECETIVQSLIHAPDLSIRQLLNRAQAADAGKNWSLKARYGITLLHLGHSAVASEMLALRSDPTQRMKLIEELKRWHGQLARLVKATASSNESSLISGISLGLGSILLDNLHQDDIAAVLPTIIGWNHDSPDLGTRNAADWLLRQWHQQVPAVQRAEPPAASRNWYINSVGMTMARISQSGSDTDGTTTPPAAFWLSDREVSRGLFQQFIDDFAYEADRKPTGWGGADTARSPTTEHPVQRVSWIDAILFCNWLSHREGHHPCYKVTGTAWKLDPDADGYRLPFEDEWERACRAGTTTRFVSGDDDNCLKWFSVYRSNQTGLCGSKMPNGWGLFDLHGNVFEWCQPPVSGATDTSVDPNHGPIQFLRGGAFDYAPDYAAAAHREKAGERYRSFTIGFRPARKF